MKKISFQDWRILKRGRRVDFFIITTITLIFFVIGIEQLLSSVIAYGELR